MSHNRELMDDARGPVYMELEGTALNFDVIMERRSGILVQLTTSGDSSSEEARLIEGATLERTRKGMKLTIPVPPSVTIVSGRGNYISNVSVNGSVIQVGNGNVQFNSFGGVRFGGGSGLVLRNGIEVKVFLPEDSDVLVERGGGLEVTGRAGLIETDFSGGDVIFDAVNELRARTSGGDIQGRFVAQRAHAKTSGGDIEIGVIRGEVDLVTSGGDVEVGEAYGDGWMKTSGGNVKLGSYYGNKISLKTSGGNIKHPEHPGISAHTSGGRINGKSPRW